MSEAAFELPQVSLGRYVDLLKRRRWQVIPVSLLGLVVGGAVAFFIPRYYVAETVLSYYRVPTEIQVAPQEDPFKFVVDNATIMLPQVARDAMAHLGWDESRETDPQKKRDLERDVEQRITVLDVNALPHRTFVRLVVQFRDRDGKRAAAFLNEVVDTWMGQRIAEMRKQVEDQSNLANRQSKSALTEWNTLNGELSNLAFVYGFRRDFSEGSQQEDLRLRGEAQAAREGKLLEAQGEVARLNKAIDDKQKEIDLTRRTVDLSSLSVAERFKAGSPEQQMAVELLRVQKILEMAGEAYPGRAEFEADAKLLKEKLERALAAGGEAVNPAIEKLRKELEELGQQLAAATAKRDALLAEVGVQGEGSKRRQDAMQEYIAKLRALGEAEDKRKAASARLAAAIEMREQLESNRPIKVEIPATVPKRPTEPNIFLVAVVGCVVGLGVAIGLILLIDVMQGTLKTVDDVERALPVPVLGAVSHLETEEQRRRQSQGRRRASLVAGLFLLGAVVVITTYYWAPHRLPPFARDLLSLVLGG